MPFAALFFMAVDVYSRDPNNRQHRLIMLLLLSISVMFLGEFLSTVLPEETAVQASRYLKLLPAFLIMTFGLLFFQTFADRGDGHTARPLWSKAAAYVPLAGIACLIFAPDVFTIDVDRSTRWHSDRYSIALIGLLAGFAVYTIGIVFIELQRVYSLLKRRPRLVMKRNRLRLIGWGSVYTVVWIAGTNLLFAFIEQPGNYVPAGTVTSYGALIFAWSVRQSMVRYHFLISPRKRYEMLLEMSRSGIAIVDEDSRIEEANAVFLRLMGLAGMPDTEWKGKHLNRIITFHDHADREAFRRKFIRFERNSREAVIYNRLNERYVLEVDSESFEMDGELKTFVIVSDVTDKKAAADRLAYLAYHDELTGLGNLLKFSEKLNAALTQETGRSIAVMLVDLDQFKWINDTLGHSMGNELLKAVAKLLGSAADGGGRFAARMGGDEFVLMIPDMGDDAEAEAEANRLRELLHQPIQLAGRPFQTTVSIGISIAPRDGSDAESIIRHADSAMHEAKRAGRNQAVMYSPAQQATAASALRLMYGLNLALEREEFELHYQPQTDLGTGRIVGVEALLRWQSAELGSVSPAEFIPLAEETGAIVPIGDWVLRKAIRDGKRWLADGHSDLLLSVNLSARQLREPRFAEYTADLLFEYGFPAANLCLEITESSAMIDPEETLHICMELARLGVTLAIDDFGTGYSSLSMLNRFPFRIVKIDKSLIRDIETSKKDAAVIRTIIQLSRHLEMDVCAEGVETLEQEKLLIRFGCRKAQGYLRGRPKPAAAIDLLLRNRGIAEASEAKS